ncbi:uncharacterized protein LOC124640404 [Helicoverpa zea]|uniref:uncharacterized protein LOC124640404 n=1 Tax=Helicoverpa zea TaxID=7113 RepID=UPI001F594BA2|nr:uncharacterized protein LOC124640404 [Helicoverpa zea]
MTKFGKVGNSSKTSNIKEKCKHYFKSICMCGLCIEKWKNRKGNAQRPQTVPNVGSAIQNKKSNLNTPNARGPNVPRGANAPRGPNAPKAPNAPRVPNVPKGPNRNIRNRTFRNISDNGVDQTQVYYFTKTNLDSNIPKYNMNSNDVIKTENFIKIQGKCEPSLQCIYLHEDHPLHMHSEYNKVFAPANKTRTFGQCYNVAPLKKRPTHATKNSKNIFTTLFLCCLRGKQNKGAKNLESVGIQQAACTNLCKAGTVASSARADVHVISAFNRDSYDFGCQYSLKSNHSLEIISQILTRSASKVSSSVSVYSSKMRHRIRKNKKSPSVLQVMMYTLARKIKDKHSKTPLRNKKNNVVVLKVPKKFSNTSTTGTISTTRNSTKLEKPLVIRDDSSHNHININRVVSSRNKIWGPGEVLLKKP